MAHIVQQKSNGFVPTQERHYTDMLRCSRETKEKILNTCASIILNIEDPTVLSQGLILQKLADHIIANKNSIQLSQKIINKIMINCRHEYLKYHKDRIEDKITIQEMIEIMAIHYIESDPR